MQKIIIQEIEQKTGAKDGREWTRYTIKGQDGSSLSTFDPQAGQLEQGDIIEAELEVKGKYTNIKSFEVVGHQEYDECEEEVAAETKPKLEKVKRETKGEREKSIDEAVAVKAVVEMAGNGTLEQTHPLVTAVKSWCCDKLGDYLPIIKAEVVVDTPKGLKSGVAKGFDSGEVDCGIDMAWLREFMGKVKWNDATCETWIEATFKVKRADSLENTICLLNNEQKAKLCDFLTKAAVRK